MPTPDHEQVYSLGPNTPKDALGPVTLRKTDILVDDVVDGVTDVDDMAQDVVDAINAATSSPDYDGRVLNGNRVVIIASAVGTTANGAKVDVTTHGDVVVSDILDMTGGVAASELDPATSVPGSFVKTFGSKMYVCSGPVLHFSGIGEPTIFTPEAVGAGFIDMSTYASGAEDLVCLENYYENMVVFTRNTIQIWGIDPDPVRNAQVQVLRNMGTFAPHSVASVGDLDLFFLTDAGIRSLRPSGTSLAAGVTEAGLPIDSLVRETVESLPDPTVEAARSVVEPLDQRYWLVMGDKIFVFSRFVASKISAWSIYEPGLSFTEVLRMGKQVYARAGDSIYLYGGSSGTEVDDSPVTVRLPYLDAQKPADWKLWRQLNMAAEGTWAITTYTDPINTTEADAPTELVDTTYGKLRYPIQAHSTHLSLLLEHEADEDARISNIAVHFESGEPE